MKHICLLMSIFLLFSCHHSRRHVSHHHSSGNANEEYSSNIKDHDGGTKPTTQSENAPSISPEGNYEPDGYEVVKVKSNLSEQLINRRSYICSYNKDIRCANWVGWYLSAEHADGTAKRKGMEYLEDDESIKGRQLLTDWEDTYDYDHGHMCPSGDNKWDREAMRQTFYLSNMCVQQSQLNQESWEHLESTCRQWAKKFGGIYIVCGPMFSTKPIKKIGGNLSVPDKFYKVVLCLKGKEGQPQAIGFIYDNVKPAKKDKLESHATSVDKIEAMTDMDFFSKLPDNIENQIESDNDIRKWRIY